MVPGAEMDGALAQVEEMLRELLSGTRPAVLFEAMRHAVIPGGKRIRPLICMASAVAVGGTAEDALFPACAIELLPSYTLVHDDLPSMDNDRLRRGKPSVWAKFGEATAILAGDALQALAFSTASRTPRNGEKILSTLAEAAVGVVQGQIEDIAADRYVGGAPTADIDFIYRHKTADLFMAAAAMGGYAGGGTDIHADHLRRYGLSLGLAFQHADDILDGDSPYRQQEAQRNVDDFTAAAKVALGELPGRTAFLSSLADRLAARIV